MKTVVTVTAVILLGITGLVGCLALSFGAETLALKWKRYFAPQHMDVETDVYRNTKAYREGSIRDLRRLKREYEKEDAAGRASLRTIIFQRADELDWDDLPSDVQSFLNTL